MTQPSSRLSKNTCQQPDDTNLPAIGAIVEAGKARNSDLKTELVAWSPIASLKSNGDINNGGTLIKSGASSDALTDYESCLFAPTEDASHAGYDAGLRRRACRNRGTGPGHSAGNAEDDGTGEHAEDDGLATQ